MLNFFREKQTIKILFINPAYTDVKSLLKSIENLPIIIAYDRCTNQSYILDTQIKARK